MKHIGILGGVSPESTIFYYLDWQAMAQEMISAFHILHADVTLTAALLFE